MNLSLIDLLFHFPLKMMESSHSPSQTLRCHSDTVICPRRSYLILSISPRIVAVSRCASDTMWQAINI